MGKEPGGTTPVKAEKQEITGHDPGSTNYPIYGGRNLCIYGSSREEAGERGRLFEMVLFC